MIGFCVSFILHEMFNVPPQLENVSQKKSCNLWNKKHDSLSLSVNKIRNFYLSCIFSYVNITFKIWINTRTNHQSWAMESNKNKTTTRTTTRNRKSKLTLSEPSTSSRQNGDVQNFVEDEEEDNVRPLLSAGSGDKVGRVSMSDT